MARELAAAPAPRPLDIGEDYLRRCGRTLHANGWFASVAGETDFAAGAKAVARMSLMKRKGLYVWGGFGCGKTSYLRAVAAMMRRHPLWVDCGDPESADMLNVSEWPNWNRAALFRDVILDDLGAEMTRNDYGVRRETAGEFIVRYHLRGRGRLFVSTNLTSDQMDARYGMRVCSRIKELCLPLHLKGADKRRFAT